MSSFDQIQQAAALIGLGAILLTLGLVVQVALLRLVWRRRERVAQAAIQRWRPLLLHHALGEDVALAALARGERFALILLWNQIAESLRGPAHDRLPALLVALGLDRLARRWLNRRDRQRQWLSLLTLGHLARAADWDAVLLMLVDRQPHLSLSAARALLQIDGARAAAPVLAQLERRADWPLAQLALLLREAGAQHLFEPLQAGLLRAAEMDQVRLLRLLVCIDTQRAAPIVLRLLHESDHFELLSVCLQHVQSAAALPRVRSLSRHPVWWLRSQAAAALARIGTADDRPLLLGLLTDPQWWVRYRAAQALLRSPGVTRPVALELQRSISDRFARDVLEQAMVERDMAAGT